MSVYISVVSHGHSDLINNLGCLQLLSKDFFIILKSNKDGDNFSDLAKEEKVHWLDKDYGLGFGHNNNINYQYCINELGMNNDDLFIVFNPDVFINADEIYKLLSLMEKDHIDFSCINLFKDKELSIYDNSIRKFPSLFQFVKSFLGLGNDTVLNKDLITCSTPVDWAAGSFLAFTANRYNQLKGFDESYFMYCEDIDICYRSYKQDVPIYYYPQIKALHYAKHANRKLFSKHMYWHISSVFRFLLTKKGLTKSASTIGKI
ncbi:glycosyltransferase family 2 protein [Photobacterium damselae subsp. damselae]|uniref:glycosyltransferase family 2 protein n=1 Tax=Photobacterium damselae TaxID=38293 RepID=UPI000A2F9A44|nr:glycosyltransferase family 2 protein [Photobacterium damselae]ARR49843.1 glycosyl transferase family 2 [Photobacterium damselae subsp. damselae]QAY35611.1 glycosyltransferase family 2 protein [Photobacterium damselae subsp. damselae]